jgi:hypothetical protein
MTNKKVARPFNEAATPYSFEILFNADLFNAGFENLQKLTKALGMQSFYRADDEYDSYNVASGVLANPKSEMGKGAILTLTQPSGAAAQFSIHGYAYDRKGLEVLDALYDTCVKTIYDLGGKLQAPFQPDLERLRRNTEKPKAP